MLSLVHFDLLLLLEMTKSQRFPEIELGVSVSFCSVLSSQSVSLASIKIGDRVAEICIHEILNRNDTPRRVIEFVLIHELLHILIRPRQIEGRMVSHPPEFWEAEASKFPERRLVWDWLNSALWPCVKLDKKREAAIILRGWPKKVRNQFPTIDAVRTGADLALVGTASASGNWFEFTPRSILLKSDH